MIEAVNNVRSIVLSMPSDFFNDPKCLRIRKNIEKIGLWLLNNNELIKNIIILVTKPSSEDLEYGTQELFKQFESLRNTELDDEDSNISRKNPGTYAFLHAVKQEN